MTPVSGAAPDLTRVLNSVAALPCECITNGMTLNTKLVPEESARKKTIKHCAAFVKAYFKAGGMEIEVPRSVRRGTPQGERRPEERPSAPGARFRLHRILQGPQPPDAAGDTSTEPSTEYRRRTASASHERSNGQDSSNAEVLETSLLELLLGPWTHPSWHHRTIGGTFKDSTPATWWEWKTAPL